MSEEIKTSEDVIKDIVGKSGIAVPQKNDQRILKIISQARRNVGTRDFILLIFVRFWMVLAEFTCKVIAGPAKHKEENSDSKIKPANGENLKE